MGERHTLTIPIETINHDDHTQASEAIQAIIENFLRTKCNLDRKTATKEQVSDLNKLIKRVKEKYMNGVHGLPEDQVGNEQDMIALNNKQYKISATVENSFINIILTPRE